MFQLHNIAGWVDLVRLPLTGKGSRCHLAIYIYGVRISLGWYQEMKEKIWLLEKLISFIFLFHLEMFLCRAPR